MPVRQFDAQTWCDDALKEHGLYEQGWRTNFFADERFHALCDYDAKRIKLSRISLNSSTEKEIRDTIIHEIAHALVGPNHFHNDIWKDKARELGLEDPKACRQYNPDSGRGLKPEEIKPKRQFNRLDKLCPVCGKKAVESSSITMGQTRWAKLECGHLVKAEQIKASDTDYSTWTSKSGKVIFPYQVEGIHFLEKAGGRALIADEPGLGKTIQALGFVFFHTKDTTPVLWVCKTTLKLQALKEALDWCGPEFMGQIIEGPRSMIIPGLKLYIISMDMLRRMPKEKMESIGYKTVVADEIQHFKNPDSTRTAELRHLVAKSDYFIPLSGTPWKNRGQEYFPVLNMLDATRFSSYKNFKDRWVDYYMDPTTGKIKQGGLRNIPAFKEYTKDMVIRRLRDDVLPDLPKINRQIRFIDMENLYKSAYDKAEERVARVIKAALIDGKPMSSIAAEIMKLKHITGLAKVQVAIEDTIDFLEQTEEFEKITIFHHHVDVGDNLQNGDQAKTYKGINDWLKANGLNPSLRLFGGRPPTERDDIIGKFKSDPKNRVLIASTLASGEGLNIQFCQNAMMVERQWNPANEEQAELRFSRPITKTDMPDYLQHLAERQVSIRIPYLIADQTIDSMLTEIVERKRTFFRKAMNNEENIKWEENEIMQELANLIIKKRFSKSKEAVDMVDVGVN